ncbi:MAG TPA: hypothetical protein VE398_18965 [Acidobacteriota bacterium]|nr:hypothetical protein [Acidobacteriota bacterium]
MNSCRLTLPGTIFLVFASSPVVLAQGSGMMGSGTLPSFIGYGGHEMNQNLVLPQIAVGQHYTTSILLLSMANAQQMNWVTPQNLKTTGKMYFYKQDGSQLSVGVNGGSPAPEYAFSLDPSQTASFDLGFAGADTPGWALIAVDDNPSASSLGMMDGLQMSRGARIMATVFYTYRDASQAQSRVGVIPSMYEMGRFKTSLMAVESGQDLYTGVAIVNTSTTTVNVQLRLKDVNGNVLATTPLSLAAGNQIAKFSTELFGNALPLGMQGFMEISTNDDGVVALGLLVSQGIMTSIPVMHYGQISMMP